MVRERNYRELIVGTPLEELNVKLQLPVIKHGDIGLNSISISSISQWIKPIHSHCMMELYNHMATVDGKKNIMSECRAANIQDGSDAQNLDAVCALLRDEIAVRSVGYSRDENQNVSDSDEKWESNRGTFEAIQEMQDEFDDKGGIN